MTNQNKCPKCQGDMIHDGKMCIHCFVDETYKRNKVVFDRLAEI